MIITDKDTMQQNIKAHIEILQALARGKTIQCRSKAVGGPTEWYDIAATAGNFNFAGFEYRVKPSTTIYDVAIGGTFVLADVDKPYKLMRVPLTSTSCATFNAICLEGPSAGYFTHVEQNREIVIMAKVAK